MMYNMYVKFNGGNKDFKAKKGLSSVTAYQVVSEINNDIVVLIDLNNGYSFTVTLNEYIDNFSQFKAMKEVKAITNELHNITEGAVYSVLWEIDDLYVVVDNKGYIMEYRKSNFIEDFEIVTFKNNGLTIEYKELDYLVLENNF